MVFYWWLAVTYGLTRLLYEIYGFKIWVTLTWHWRFKVKVKCHGIIWLVMYMVFYWWLTVTYGLTWLLYERQGFEFWVNMTWPFRSFKVKSNGAVGLSIYGFLLMANSNLMSISARLGDICTVKRFPYLLSLPSPRPTLTPRRRFSKSNHFIPVRGKAPTKYEVEWLNTFWGILLRHTHRRTDRHTHTHRKRLEGTPGGV